MLIRDVWAFVSASGSSPKSERSKRIVSFYYTTLSRMHAQSHTHIDMCKRHAGIVVSPFVLRFQDEPG